MFVIIKTSLIEKISNENTADQFCEGPLERSSPRAVETAKISHFKTGDLNFGPKFKPDKRCLSRGSNFYQKVTEIEFALPGPGLARANSQSVRRERWPIRR